MYALENLRNIEVLVFSNFAFSLEVLMNEHEPPGHFVKISLTTHEVILAIAGWEKCFGFMIRPQVPETHVTFKKIAPGSWRVALQGSKQNILKLMLATGFEVIRFSVADFNSNLQPSDDSIFGYSIRVPLTRIACKMDIFLKELASTQQPLLVGAGNTPSYEEQQVYANLQDPSVQHPGQRQAVESNNVTNYHHEGGVGITLPSISEISRQIGSPQIIPGSPSSITPDSSPTWGRVPLRTMDESPNVNEGHIAYVDENSTQITETIRLSKGEVSAIIGPQAKRIIMIRNATHCRISVLPVTLETMNSRFRTHDFPQTISLMGKPHQVAQAKIMLRRALLEFRSK